MESGLFIERKRIANMDSWVGALPAWWQSWPAHKDLLSYRRCRSAPSLRTLGKHSPSVIQGATSYTVVPTGNRAGLVVWFRTAENAFNIDLLSFVQEAYGSRFVLERRYYGDLGDLKVFTMTNI
ncbi:hypothetical protein B0T17DRAFT_399575 [Bombardia bombarda]|uniref:Uncharacterized protein n=1 Tax=Bombardia bombarda TaxID=252184 RepID=A0AA39U6W7_9PEZI|nr:hypothetical protein B0T17DRAFT_399575 [Bombardia bombarda]